MTRFAVISDDDAFADEEVRVDDVVRLRITPAELGALRAWAKQWPSRRSRRRHATKTTSMPLARKIAEAVVKKEDGRGVRFRPGRSGPR